MPNAPLEQDKKSDNINDILALIVIINLILYKYTHLYHTHYIDFLTSPGLTSIEQD